MHNSLTHSYYGTNWTRFLCSILFCSFTIHFRSQRRKLFRPFSVGFFLGFFFRAIYFRVFFSSTPFYRLISSKLFPTSNVLLGNCTSMRFCTVRVLSMEIHINYTTNGNRKPRIRRKKSSIHATSLLFLLISISIPVDRRCQFSIFNFPRWNRRGFIAFLTSPTLFPVFPHPSTTIKIELNRVNTARVDIPICDLHFTKA